LGDARCAERTAQPLLVGGGSHDRFEIEAGKRLPFGLQHGNHLPQRFAQDATINLWRIGLQRIALGGIHHFAFLSNRPAAIMASAIFAGTTGYSPLSTALRMTAMRSVSTGGLPTVSA